MSISIPVKLLRVLKHLPVLGFRNGWRFSNLLDRYPNKIKLSSSTDCGFSFRLNDSVQGFEFREDAWLSPTKTGWYKFQFAAAERGIQFTSTLFTTKAMLDYLECALAEADEITQAEQADVLMIDYDEIDTYFLTEEV